MLVSQRSDGDARDRTGVLTVPDPGSSSRKRNESFSGSLVYSFVETPRSCCIEFDVMFVIGWSSKDIHLTAADG